MTIKNWITEYKLNYKDILFSVQILLVAFGALITLPLLTGLDPNVGLFAAGAGTLLFQLLTKQMVPVFLASSFAFTAPMIYAVKTWGIPATLGGLALSGIIYLALSALIKWRGSKIFETIFPPIVVGPIIMVIGLILAPVAVSMALGKADPNNLIPEKSALLISMISLATTVIVSLLAKGILRLIPILCGMAAGYLVSLPFGVIDFSIVAKAPWVAVPDFVLPQWNWHAILFLVPAAIAPAVKHFGDILTIGEVTGHNYFQSPGIHRTLLGDGASTIFASCLGGPPNSTYAEITGAVAFLKQFKPIIMLYAAIIAMMLSFFSKLGALLRTIPSPALGGILILLFSTIILVGINNLKKAGTDLMEFRNLLIVGLVLVLGIGGMTFSAGAFTLKGVALASILGVILNLILPEKKPDKST